MVWKLSDILKIKLTSFDRGQNTNRDILNRWTPENPNGTIHVLLSFRDTTHVSRFLPLQRSFLYRVVIKIA